MYTVERPAIMNFEVPDLMKQRVTVSDQLPEHYSKYRIPGTVAHITEGPFGAFFKQEVHTKDWIVGWLNFDIKEHTFLYPITSDPLLALYTGLNGNIPCELQGSAEKLMLPEKKFAFYYVPPMAFNRAEFSPAHYTAVYLSFSPSFMQYFGNKYEAYKPLVEKQLRGEQEGEQKNLIPLGNTARDIIQAMGAYRQAPAMFEPYLHGQVLLLTAHYFNLLMDRHEVPKTVLDACDFIQCNLTEDIDTAFVARKAGTHKDALNKLFKETYGKNVRQYITHLRLEEAEYRLLNTKELIWEVAAHANLTDASHLVRLMRGKHGLTPEEFREKHRNSLA